MKDPYRIHTGNLVVGEREKRFVNQVLDSSLVSEGRFVKRFEDEWAKYIGTEFCVAMNSGSSALMAGMIALGHTEAGKKGFSPLGRSIEVATTPFTYMATVNSIGMAGHIPVFVDIEGERLGMDPERLAQELEENPSIEAVLPVHIMGIPCRIDEIARVCRRHKVRLAEDNCQGYGSKYKGKMLGSFGLWSACSFFIAHTVQVGEMGCLNTSDRLMRRLFEKVKSNGRTSEFDWQLERFYADSLMESLDLHKRYYHDIEGGNFRTQEFSAAMACGQMGGIKGIIRRRNDNVRFLIDELSDLEPRIRLPVYSREYAYLGFPVVLNDARLDRATVRARLERMGVETRPMYGCLPLDMPSLGCYRERYKGRLPVAERVGRKAFYVGCHQFLEQSDLEFLARAIRRAVGKTSG